MFNHFSICENVGCVNKTLLTIILTSDVLENTKVEEITF